MSELKSRELDKLIAELLGWDDIEIWEAESGAQSLMGVSPNTKILYGKRPEPIPDYSTDASVAVYLVLKLGLHVGPMEDGWYASDQHDFNAEDIIIEFAPRLSRAVSEASVKILQAKKAKVVI
jgi:hypothetical protein